MSTSKLPKRDANGKFIANANGVKAKRKKKPPSTSSTSSGLRWSAQKIVQRASKKHPPIGKTLKTTKQINHAALVIDCSGSMQNVWPTVQRELKNNIGTIRGESIRTGQDTTLTLTVFGDYVKQIYDGKPIQDAKLPENIYPDMGYTSLYDAVAQTIASLERTSLKDDDSSMIVIVLTDGEENNSKILATQLKAKIEKLQKTDRWSFAFLVPPNHKEKITKSLGLPEGNVIEWEGNEAGAKFAGASVTRGLSTYYTSRASGGTSTKGFFNYDAPKLSTTQIERTLDDVTKKVKIWPVPREIAIREFVESKIGQYTLGTAYYQLTKDELLEDTKDILVMLKGQKTVYGGFQARSLLGIPSGTTKIRPGNLSAFDLFVKSSSVNRRLVRGTKLIVMLDRT